MEKPLIAQARSLERVKVRARGIAEQLLSQLNLQALVEDPENSLKRIREQLTIRLRGPVQSAFRAAKWGSWRMIAMIPPEITIKKPPRTMNPAEQDAFANKFEAWTLKVKAINVSFLATGEAWAAGLRLSGMSGEAMLLALKQDWNRTNNNGSPAGRITGQWKREIVSAAEELVSRADAHGQYCANHGIGEEF